MRKVEDYVHEYDGHNACYDQRGRCRIRIFERADGVFVVVCTPPPGSSGGLSITNAVEYVAADVFLAFFAEADEPPIWLEHHPARNQPGVASLPEWARVRFEEWRPMPHEVSGQERMRAGVPRWEFLEPRQAAEILRGTLHGDA